LSSFKNGQYDKCENLAKLITKEFPEHQFGWKALGAVLIRTKRMSEALNANQQAARIAPHDPEAHNNLGISLFEMDRVDEAEASFRQAVVLKPDNIEAYIHLGNTLKTLKKLDEAESTFQKIIELKPDVAENYNNLALIQKEQGKFKEAESNYTKAIELKENFDTALLNRSKLFFDKGDYESALRDSDSCNTKDSKVHSLEVLYALGQIDEIYKRLEFMSEIDGKNINIAAFSTFIAEQEKKKIRRINFVLIHYHLYKLQISHPI
jgi:tetratricopeptide (TPR) repeat protein